MDGQVVPTVIVSGTLGAGKTAVSDEISVLLEEARVPHGLMDVDCLDQCFPAPAEDPWGEELACANLAAVWTNFRARGAKYLVLARAIQGREQLEGYRGAIPEADITVVRLVASPETLRRRLQQREAGSLRGWFLGRVQSLAQELEAAGVEDFVVDNDGRPVRDVAREILGRLGWLAATNQTGR